MGTWTHPALARKRETASRNDAVERTATYRMLVWLPSLRDPQPCAGAHRPNSQASLVQASLVFPDAPSGVTRAGGINAYGSGKRRQKRLDSVE